MPLPSAKRKRLLMAAIVAVVVLAAWWAWNHWQDDELDGAFVSGNGRIEAIEIDVAARQGGRVEEVLVREGDFVTAGQPLARLQLDTLNAQYDEAVARQDEALHAIAAADAQVAQRQSDVAAQKALVVQRRAELNAVKRRLARSEALVVKGAVSRQELDDDRANMSSAEAVLAAAQAQVVALEAAVKAAEAQRTGAESRQAAAKASVARIAADIADNTLKAPRDGRVQLRLAEPGEVLAAGGRVFNLIDVSDVYMTFFVPQAVAGRIALGSEVRIVLDAAPEYPVPAKVSFVSNTAQFTPKTVETASEREKLMFRVRASIAPELLQRYREHVKTGMPGVAWLRLDPQVPWPERLTGGFTEPVHGGS
ncbi:MAG: HlyD family efflux transporter periplasmic adaptor subunit [Pigmentiphaga sp.]|nr:HlyD family efflux transporter periplasmic adaptor subunit [Pigmentiphaga sp.]